MAHAKGRAKARPRKQPSPARTAALIGVAALVLLLSSKLVGILTSEAGKERVARRTDGARAWLAQLFTRGAPPEPPAVSGLASALTPFGIAVSEIRRQVLPEVGTGRESAERWEVPVPPKVSLVQLNLAVTSAAPALGLEVRDAWEEAGGRELTMALAAGGEERYRLVFSRRVGAERSAGQVAIVINGIGSSWDATSEALLDFPAPISWGVLPGFRSSKQIARAARGRGIEVLLSMPMEPKRYPQVDPGAGAILMHMSPAEVRARLRQGFESVGEVAGVVSYMGSMATTDAKLMRVVLDEVKRKDLFFVDSRAASGSVVSEVARQLGTPCVASALFIDGEGDSQEKIAQRLDRVMDAAESTGKALGIGHSYPETLAALRAALPELAARRLVLVPVSALLAARAPAEIVGSL